MIFKKTKLLIISFITTIWFLMTFLLYGCSYNESISEEHLKKMNLFISQRSFSLMFESNNKEYGYGTGWLIGKDNTKKKTYYLATNLHVAEFINDANKEFYSLNEYGEYQLKKGVEFNKLYFGQVHEKNSTIIGTEKDTTNFVKYFEYVNINDVSVAYTPIDYMNSFSLYNQYKIYDSYYLNNATIDFAILKINFENAKWNEEVSEINFNPIDYALKNYDESPTKFAKTVSKNNLIMVGGFPAIDNNHNNRKGSIYKTMVPSKYNYIGYGNEIFDRSDWKPLNIDDDDVKKYELKNMIKYIYNGYTSMLNVSKQLMIENLNLPKGSSGSIAINSNFEVVGIYWGVYTMNNNKTLGAIDLLINDETRTNKDKNFLLKPYNIINDFSHKLK